MMFSENKDNERRAPERRRDGGGQHSIIRHRIPYRLLGRRSLRAKRLVVSSKVLFPAIPTHNCDVVLTFPANTEDATLMWLLARLKSRAPSLTVNVRHHSHTGIYGFYLTAVFENLLQGAEELGILKPIKSELGGGMKEFATEDQDCFAGIEDEATFLTSQERQNIVLHFLHELRATGDDTLEGISFIEGQPIVPLLITKKVVSQVFPLHNDKDLSVLRQKWVQAIFSWQPLDLVCRYFGVKIALYFAYLGHYTIWLLLPALVGFIIFLMQGSNQTFEDLCFVGFALFNVVWATFYLKFWKRSSTEYCYRWGTLEKKDELLKDPRPLFKGDLVKSPVTGQLELAYPSWKRHLFRYFVTFPVIAVCLAVVFLFMLLCFELQEWVNELIAEDELPYVFSFVPKVLLAVVVSVLDEVYKQIAIWLTYKENYRLEESHETSLVIKLVLFQFVNSFLSLFYIGFYLKDMDRLRDQLAALLITRQVLGNVKEALMPYIIWKARLYSVGYRIATRMSPASVEKEVRRMTTHSKTDVNSSKPKGFGPRDPKKDSDSDTVTEEDEERLPVLTQAEVESAMKKYEDTLDDYLEMCIQFGYVTLFSSAFPLAALCALLNNIIEIRSDAFKLCFTYQRVFGARVESIGIWQDILLGMSVLAVIVNCALIGTSGLLERLLPGLDITAYWAIIVLMEHVIIMTKIGLYRSIDDFPPGVAAEMARLEYQRTEAMKQLLSQMASSHGGGSLVSHYPGSPGMRRKRPSEIVDPGARESSPPINPDIASKASAVSPSVITPSSTVTRPSDIHLASTATKFISSQPDSQKPVAPPRASRPTSEPPPKVSISHTDVAEKVVAAVMNPVFDTLDSKYSSQPFSSSSSIPSSSTSTYGFPPRPSIQPVMSETTGGSQIMRRVYRSRADMEARRRRSEPVSQAIRQALSMQENMDDSGIRKKDIYENKEDLREGLQDEVKRKGISLRDEIRKSKERINLLDSRSDRERKSEGKDSQLSGSASKDQSSSSSSSHPPPSAARYCASPRLLRGGALGDPSHLISKVLSRKSRSFSSADVNEAKQAFRDRTSWKGELSSLAKDPSSQKPDERESTEEHHSDLQADSGIAVTSSDNKDPEKSASGASTLADSDSGAAKNAITKSHDKLTEKKQNETSTGAGAYSVQSKEMSGKPPKDPKPSGSKGSLKSGSEPRLNFFKAMRESAAKPLSLSSKSLDSKNKKQ